MLRLLAIPITALWAMAADRPAAAGVVRQAADLLPFEIGVGGLIAVAAAFWLGRMCRPARRISPAAPLAPARPVNLIRRLDELEHLMELGVLTREEFETEKDKLRNLK